MSVTNPAWRLGTVAKQLVVPPRVPVEPDERARHDHELCGEIEVVQEPERDGIVQRAGHRGWHPDPYPDNPG
jgi:hypothetical protein